MQKKEKEKVEVRSEIIEGLYTIKIEDVGLTMTQLQEKIEAGKITTFTNKQKEYISQLIIKGFVQEMFKLKGVETIVGFRTLSVVGAQNSLMVLKEMGDEIKIEDKGFPESYINNMLQILFVGKYLSKFGDKHDVSEQPQAEYEKAENIRKRYEFVKTLPGLVVDSLYGKIQEFNNSVGSSIAMDNIENF